jgi:hypothetical protein
MRKSLLSTVVALYVLPLAAILGTPNHVLAQTFTLITPVSATAEVNNADAPNTIDNNPNEFTALTTIWQAAGENPCITFDLGGIIRVAGFRETSGPFPANPFTAFVSTDGVNFTIVFSGTLTQFAFGEHFFTPRDARFFKLCVQRTDATGFGELADFRALAPAAVGFTMALTAKVEIQFGPLANDDVFEVKAPFTLGAGSDGIAPLTEAVSFQVGTFSTTILASSFTQDTKGRFKFEGVINGVFLEAVIRPLNAGSFEFKAEGQGVDLTGTVNPVNVGLTIGNDNGTTTVTAEFE